MDRAGKSGLARERVFESPTRVSTAPDFWKLYGTQEKLNNYRELKRQGSSGGTAEIDAYPWKIYLEPTARCNLCCCDWEMAAPGRLDLTSERAVELISQLELALVQVNLFYWGEPLLNPNLPAIIDEIHRRDIGTKIQSNFLTMNRAMATDLVNSGLDVIVAMIDGATQKVYSENRQGGHLANAIENLGIFLAIRRLQKKTRPRVIWRFTLYGNNEYEASRARRLANKLGVDEFVIDKSASHRLGWTPDALPETQINNDAHVRRALWSEPVILTDGRLVIPNADWQEQESWKYVDDGFFQAFNAVPFYRMRMGGPKPRSVFEDTPACVPALCIPYEPDDMNPLLKR